MKVLLGMALRQTTGFVESLLHLVALDWAVPDFSTLSRRQQTLAVNNPVSRFQRALASADPLSFHCFAMHCRSVDALCETAGAAPHGAGLRPSGR